MIINFFKDYPHIIAGITTAKYGNCSNTLITQGITPDFHQYLFDTYQMDKIHVGKLIHTDIISNISTDDLSEPQDALITNTPKTLIGVTTADCIPIFLFDTKQNALGIVHSGRKGLFLNITNKTIQKMIQDFNTDIADLIIQIGPHICSKCYEVDQDILQEFNINNNQKKGYLPMQDILINDLLKLNIPINNIRTTDLCTLCSKDTNDKSIFYSHRRRDKERMLSFIGYI